uniref:Uncharacterized protein n=1 Tax=Lynx canadensis TaxID=61383 RepID=A0A667H6X9_LYNCA
MLMNCTGVQTRQFMRSAGQKLLLIWTERAAALRIFPASPFMTRRNNNRKAGAKRRRSRRSLLTPAQGTSEGIQCSMKR